MRRIVDTVKEDAGSWSAQDPASRQRALKGFPARTSRSSAGSPDRTNEWPDLPWPPYLR